MLFFKILLKIFSIDSGERKLKRREKLCFKTKAFLTLLVFLTALVCSLFYKFKIMISYLNVSIFWSDILQTLYDFVQYTIDLYFVYKYGKEKGVRYHEHFESFDNILKSGHCDEIETKLNKLTIGFLIFWLSSSCADIFSWSFNFNFPIASLYLQGYVFFLIKILTSLDLTVQVTNITCRLEVINKFLQECYVSAKALPCVSPRKVIKDCVGSEDWLYVKNVPAASQGRQIHHVSWQNVHDTKWLTRCYLLLFEQTNYINCMFGFRFLLNSLSFLIDMVRFLNIVVRMAIGSQHTENSAGNLPAAVTVALRLTLCVATLTSLVRHCELAYRQTERISNVATHILLNKNPDEPLRSSVMELRDLVVSKPILFSAADFFTLNYSFLMSVASVVVTYTIILLES